MLTMALVRSVLVFSLPASSVVVAPQIDNDIGEKIDYVLVQPGATVLRAEIIRTVRDGRYLSDHFPVVARVALP
jgi:endonuclease/exonuclease/phosphatase family metal-dependent hydrolase